MAEPRRLALRNIAQIGVASGSLAFVVGGVLIWQGALELGDGLMIGGGIALLASALMLARTPTGDTIARKTGKKDRSDAG